MGVPHDPGLPLKLEAGQVCSNGEVAPVPPSPLVREAMRRARLLSDRHARRLGMDRRDFLVSSMGMATALWALAACSSEDSASRGEEPGGSFDVPEDAMVDADAALEVLGDDQPVIDVQTHLLEYPDDYEGPGLGVLFPYGEVCGEANPSDCFTIERWQEELFDRSDTTVAVLSAISAVGEVDPLSAEVMDRARARVDELCGDGRVLVQGHAWPNVGPLEAALDAMRAEAERYPIVAWKTYTHVGGDRGFRLTDDLGNALLEEVARTGPPILCVHKGLVRGAADTPIGDPVLASPDDVGPAAADHPDVTIVVYHSGAEMEVVEGSYDPEGGGVDRLVRSLQDAGIEPGGNVYAELGWTWRAKMGDPDQAAHLLGKLLLAVGEDNLLWGTDSIWAGSPQDQIEAFRAFRISERLQEEHGYPALTDEVKHKILWRNAARLYGVDVYRQPCRPAAEAEGLRRDLGRRRGNRTFGPRTASAARRLFAAEHPWLRRGR
ncbi:MAG TPA: amidohydrolase family protein [Acidimicrobiales bacterium]